MKLQEALKAAIEALEASPVIDKYGALKMPALNLCKAALTEIEKCEPVAWTDANFGAAIVNSHKKYLEENYPNHKSDKTLPLCLCGTSPISKEWLSLTDEQLEEIIKDWATDKIESHRDYADAISSKLKQLNFTK